MTPPTFTEGTVDIPTYPSTVQQTVETLPRSEDRLAVLKKFRRFSTLSGVLRRNERILRERPATPRHIPKKGVMRTLLSLCIILTVTTVTCSIAGAILYASIMDRRSNIRLAAAFVGEFMVSHESMAANAAAGSGTDLLPARAPCDGLYRDGWCDQWDQDSGEACAKHDPDCDVCATQGWDVSSGCNDTCPHPTSLCPSPTAEACRIRAINPAAVSIVDYLLANDLPSSFADRQILARTYHLEQYRGAAAQNRHLLGILQQNLPARCNSETTDSVF